MAGFGEPWQWTKQREEEAKTIFPTLEVANPDEIMDVDMFRFQNLNQPPTNFSQSALSLANYANIPEPTPEAPDVAPNVEGWTPRISPPQTWGEPTYDPSRPDTLLQRTPGFTPLELYQRVSQGSLGFFTGSTPSESARRFVSGVEGEETFSPYELGFVRNLPEGSALREPLARIEAQLVDPINLLTMGQAGAARAIATGIIGEEATRAAARAFGASPETQETLGTIANIAGNIIPVRPKTWMQAADEALGVQQAAERAAVPEALQIGRAAGEGRVPFYGGTRPGEVPVPLNRPSLAGAAEIEPSLPNELARSAPRYKTQPIDFESDMDKALYTVGNLQTRSKSHEKFMQWLRNVTGMEDREIYSMARQRRAEIIDLAKTQADEERITIPRAVTAAEEAAPVAAPQTTAFNPQEVVNKTGFDLEVNGVKYTPEPGSPGEAIRAGKVPTPKVLAAVTKIDKAINEVDSAPGLRRDLVPTFRDKAELFNPIGEKNSFQTEVVGNELRISAYDDAGNQVANFVGNLSGPDSGAFVVTVREDARRLGYGNALLNEASNSGFSIVENISKNNFSSEGKALVKNWLLNQKEGISNAKIPFVNAEQSARAMQEQTILRAFDEKGSQAIYPGRKKIKDAVPEAAVAPETAAAGGVPPEPPVPPTIPGRGGYVPSNEFKSTPTLTRLYGVETIKEGKTRGLGERFGMTGRIRADDPIVTPAMTVRNEARNAVVNQATRITTQVRNAVRRSGFEFDEFGRIPALQGVDPTLEFEGTAIAPTLRDVAARLPNFENALTQQQRNALEEIRNAIQPYRTALDEVRAVEESITGKPSLIAIGSRQDVMDGGFYIPRGNAETEEMAEIAAGRLRRPGRGGAGKQGFEQTATFPSESYGIELGYNYTPVDEAVGSYVRGAGNRAIDRHVANYLLSRVDETGKRIAKKLADSDTRLTGRVSLAGLDQYSFPAVLADEAEKEIRSTRMSDNQAFAALKFVNDTMRGVQATGEVSYLGIQNAIGNIVDPAAGSAATKASLKAWLNAGDEVLGDYIARFDVKAAEAARPTSEKWAASGLRLGESGTEFQTVRKLPRKFSEKLEQAPEIVKKVGRIPRSIAERADRGFGVAGDTMRLELADTMAEEWMVKYGRSLTNKELKTIAESVNRVTGWTGEKFFNNWADFLNFAPRYLTARFRSVSQLASSDPMKRQLARRLVGRYVGIMSALTLAGNYLNGEETDFRPFSGSKGPTFNPLDAEYKNPNFMRLKNVMGRDWSLLGPVDAVLGTGIAIGSLATNPPSNAPDAAKRMRAVLTAPFASAFNDWVVQGETFDGRPLRWDTTEGIQDIAKRFAPFGAVQIAPDIARAAGEAAGGDYLKAASDSAGSAIAGFFGGRGSRLTPRERVINGEYYKLTPDEQLRALPAQSWREIGKNEKVPENLRNVINEYQSISQWKSAAEDAYYKRAIDAGYTKSAADKWAKSKVESNQISKFYNTAKNYYESEWIKNNPRLAEEIIIQDKKIEDPRKKRLSPREEDIAVIQQALGK
jgi:hypothetical protein